jgi:hypothetical protein
MCEYTGAADFVAKKGRGGLEVLADGFFLPS